MPITSTKHQFNESNIDTYAPDGPGVYGLYESIFTPIYIGSSEENIKSRLKSHLSGAEGKCTKEAEYFNTELHDNPKQREKELLEEHNKVCGKLPKCNDVL